MSTLDRMAAAVMLSLVVLLAGGLWVCHYGAEQHQAGYDAAVADGDKLRTRAAAAALKTESDLRAQLRAHDAEALKKEEEYEANLEAARRRVRAGIDRLRCPVGPVPGGATPVDRPAAGEPAADGEGPAIVSEAAAEILGIGADVAGLVRRYDRVVKRFEACRAVNAGP